MASSRFLLVAEIILTSALFVLNATGAMQILFKLTKGKTRLNPHDLHYGEIDCLICHKTHTAKSPNEFCASCHVSMN
ncbi:MAG: cytochrome c3 family protein [Proteobacteria bacterium]|nr:cytochrome c3 family protein [Pseudomonadota bacterium]MBU4035111.1 cytochrome c3 family protein [Pseudomonadota bacterium]